MIVVMVKPVYLHEQVTATAVCRDRSLTVVLILNLTPMTPVTKRLGLPSTVTPSRVYKFVMMMMIGIDSWSQQIKRAGR